MTRRVKPLTGQVLVQILPPDKLSAGGIEIPQHTVSPEEVQATHRAPQPKPAEKGLVVAVGDWPKTKTGLHRMPEFSVGAVVFVSPYAGQQFHYGTSGRFRMVSNGDILAIVTGEPDMSWGRQPMSGPGSTIDMR